MANLKVFFKCWKRSQALGFLPIGSAISKTEADEATKKQNKVTE